MATSPKSPKSPDKTASPKSPQHQSGPASPQSPGHQPSAHAPIEIIVDEDADEGYLDDNASSSVSVISSVLKYRSENGRTYHAYKDGSYLFPNDEIENERLDLQHHMFYLTFDGRLFLNPMDPTKMNRVLDCGTGTGSWAIDFGDEHPNAQVTGIDLSPSQPRFVPPNVQFFIDDLEDNWTYDYKFDFIYSRFLTGSLGDWPKFFKQAYDNLAPGGYFEITDIVIPYTSDDGTLTENAALNEWAHYALEASRNLGRPLDTVGRYTTMMEDAGFVAVVEQAFKWPTNHWPKDPKFKELGIWMHENVGKNVSGITLALFTRGLGWSVEQCEAFLINVRKEFKDPRIHCYAPVVVVYGQKPLAA